MTAEKKYEVTNLNCRIICKTRVVFMGDTFSASEVLKPSIIDGLLAVGKIKEVGSSKKKSTQKVEKKTETKVEEIDEVIKSNKKKASKKKE